MCVSHEFRECTPYGIYVRYILLQEWAGMGMITEIKYRNEHLYVSWGTFNLVLEDNGIEYA